jgi:uncharacterized spore protein YtfJ
LNEKGELTDDLTEKLNTVIRNFKTQWVAKNKQATSAAQTSSDQKSKTTAGGDKQSPTGAAAGQAHGSTSKPQSSKSQQSVGASGGKGSTSVVSPVYPLAIRKFAANDIRLSRNGLSSAQRTSVTGTPLIR